MSEEIIQFEFGSLEGKVTKLEEEKQEIIQEDPKPPAPKPPIVPKNPRKRKTSISKSDLEDLKSRIEKLEQTKSSNDLSPAELKNLERIFRGYINKYPLTKSKVNGGIARDIYKKITGEDHPEQVKEGKPPKKKSKKEVKNKK
jgi:uncharacterized protein (UPF0335 family)